MRTLFFGLGKVNLSIARQIQGEKISFVEENNEVIVGESGGKDEAFRPVKKVSGTFDAMDFSEYLPSRVFVSPGIDPRRKFFKQIESFEARELTFFCSRFQGKIIVITGTDGKSTFTTQLGEVLKRALPHQKIFVGGNLGTGMCDALSEDYSIAVLEVSSFQAERLRAAHFDMGVLINLDVDHLDRYDCLEDYHRAKWGLLKFAVEVAYPCELTPAEKLPPSMAKYDNHENIPAILHRVVEGLSKSWGFEFSEKLLENLPTLRHRLERWTDSRGRVFINDSKATTVHAVIYGLGETQKEFPSVRLILGGKYKGDDFSALRSKIRATDEVLICGEGRVIIRDQLGRIDAKITAFKSLSELLNATISVLESGDCLLLSPGCSSYDEFENFEERGDLFLRMAKDSSKIAS